MRIGIVGSGRIGGNLGLRLASAGHQVMFSFSRDPNTLTRLAAAAGPAGTAGSPREAVEFADVVVLSVPWDAIGEALAQAGSVGGKVVIDTTNPFGRDGLVDLCGQTSATVNQRRMPGAAVVKAFNTLTAEFQAESAHQHGDDRVAMFYAANDDVAAGGIARQLIEDAGFFAVYLGKLEDSALMEAPRRVGAVYGEEYRAPQALAVATLWRSRQRNGLGSA